VGDSNSLYYDDGNIGIGTTGNSNYLLDVSGNINANNYFSNSVSAIQIPADTSDNRPINPLGGYLRYNTTTHVLEYYDGSANVWKTITST